MVFQIGEYDNQVCFEFSFDWMLNKVIMVRTQNKLVVVFMKSLIC